MITADNITDEIRPGVSVSWLHSDGTELTGVVMSHFGARLWNVRENSGTHHVIGEWILNARAKEACSCGHSRESHDLDDACSMCECRALNARANGGAK